LRTSERLLIKQFRVNVKFHMFGLVCTQAELIAVIFMALGLAGIVLLSRPRTAERARPVVYVRVLPGYRDRASSQEMDSSPARTHFVIACFAVSDVGGRVHDLLVAALCMRYCTACNGH